MLTELIFSNFKSFKDEMVLSFFPTNIREHSESLIQTNDGYSLLPVIVIYGPNGGGKSNTLNVVSYLRNRVLAPIDLVSGRLSDSFLYKLVTSGNCNFSFDKLCKKQSTKISVMFLDKENKYRYDVDIDCKGNFITEKLYVNGIAEGNVYELFSRDNDKVVCSSTLKDVSLSINSKMPVLSYLAYTYKDEVVTKIIRWFRDICVLNYDNPFRDGSISLKNFEIFMNNKKKKKIFFNLLHDMDIDIADIDFDRDTDGKITKIKTVRILNGDKCPLDLLSESSGTRKIFTFLPDLINAILGGRLVIADELDAKLHPKLLEAIIGLFTNANINRDGAQLLLTSHDMTTMRADVFRRDEIWFAALDDSHCSHIYSLAEFKKKSGKFPRNDEQYAKQYLEGRYGADPYLRKMMSLNYGEFDEKIIESEK